MNASKKRNFVLLNKAWFYMCQIMSNKGNVHHKINFSICNLFCKNR